MPTIKILPHVDLCPEGIEFNANTGDNICRTMLKHGIEIDHACEMSCACTTCHIIIKEGFNSLADADEMEEDMLDRAWGLSSQSRLSCQAKLANQNLVIEIPKYTINHAKEG